MSVTTLEDVEVRLDASPMRVCADDLVQIAASWPYVTRLVLSCKNACEDGPAVQDLLCLETACRDLTELVLPRIDLSVPEPDFGANASPDCVATTKSAIDAHDKGTRSTPVGGHPLRLLRVACQTTSTITLEQAMING